MPEQPGDQVSLARAALAAAKADARARGVRPTTPLRQSDRAGESDRVGDAGRASDAGRAGEAGRAGDDATGASSKSEAVGGGAGGPVPGLSLRGTTLAGKTSPARRGGRRSGARPGFPGQPQHADPQQLGAAINGLLDAEGWALAAATGSVFGRWAQIVGSDLAAHTTPESLSDGELTMTADSTAWATQVRLLATQLVRRLNMELGDGTVQRVKVRGPATGTRKPGEWRVRGGRGPRDTYG